MDDTWEPGKRSEDNGITFELLPDGSFRGGKSQLVFAFFPGGLVHFQESFEHDEERAYDRDSELLDQGWCLISYNCRDYSGMK